MLEVTITGVPPFDGTYPLDLADPPPNGRELHVIKQVAGVRLGEIESALDAGDYDVIVALAAIVLTRNGSVDKDKTLRVAQEVLMEAAGGKIKLAPKKKLESVDADPPAQPLSEPEKPSGENESSGPSSAISNSIGDDPQATPLRATGTPV